MKIFWHPFGMRPSKTHTGGVAALNHRIRFFKAFGFAEIEGMPGGEGTKCNFADWGRYQVQLGNENPLPVDIRAVLAVELAQEARRLAAEALEKEALAAGVAVAIFQ